MHSTYKNILWVAGLLALAGGIILIAPSTSNLVTTPGSSAAEGTVSVVIDGTHEFRQVLIDGDDTVLDVLRILDAEGNDLGLETKDYGELGVLVTRMYGLENGTNDSYWQYTVNDVMPQVGASTYVLRDGDAVEWIFAESQF